jgi:anti-sigma-K factor RskA
VSEDIHTLAPLYAVDALPSDEQAFFERHLRECPACEAEVRSHRETAALLGAAVAVAPPPGLRDALLAEVALTPQDPPLPAMAVREDRTRRFEPLAAVAAALLVAVLGMSGVAVYLLGEATPAPSVALDEDFLAVAQAARLAAPDGAAATFYLSDEHDEGWLVVAGMRDLDASQAYQLWLFHDGTPVPAGVFSVHDGQASLRADAQVIGAELVAVTIEPAGGLPEPSGPIVADASL